jgi:hypothetical protein
LLPEKTIGRIESLHRLGVAESDRHRHPVREVQDREVERRIGPEGVDERRERDSAHGAQATVLRVEALGVDQAQGVQVHPL